MKGTSFNYCKEDASVRNILYDKLRETCCNWKHGFDEWCECEYWLDTDSLYMDFHGEKIADIFDDKGRVIERFHKYIEEGFKIKRITTYKYSGDDDNEIYSRSETIGGVIVIEEVWYENGFVKRKKTKMKRIL